MKILGIVLTIVLFLIPGIVPVHGQDAKAGNKVNIGDRVRVVGPPSHEPITGRVTQLTPTTIYIKNRSMIRELPLSSIQRLDVSISQKRQTLEGLLRGSLSGGIAGGIIGFMTYRKCTDTGFMACFMRPENRGESFLWGAGTGVALGGIIGIIAGVSTIQDEWKQVPLNVSAGGFPGSMHGVRGGFAITLTWRLGKNEKR